MLPIVAEHRVLEANDPDTQERLITFAKKTKDKNTANRVLGLHFIHGESGPSVSTWWFVGQVWLPLGGTPEILRVKPKVDSKPVQMYTECVADPVVRSHLEDCVHFYWDEPPIPVEDRDDPISLLVIMRFLCLLHELCHKHLRLMITPVEANLAGRIKGKPVVRPTLRINHARARLDRTYCRFQVQSIDTVPNQILAAALHQSIKYVYQSTPLDQRLSHLAAFSAGALSGVTLRRILPTDFQGLHYAGFLRPYREPHRWARLVLRLLEEISGKRETSLPPFAIDMKELFERYCEARLRKVSSQEIWAGYKRDNIGPGFLVRPDFLVSNENERWVVDAKYKENWSWAHEDERADVFQIVSYCSHRGVLLRRGLASDTKRPTAVILYPGSLADRASDQTLGLDLERLSDEAHMLRGFEVDVARIPVNLPSGSSRNAVPDSE